VVEGEVVQHLWDCSRLLDGERCTFNSRIIFIDEMALYQLNRQAGFSDSTSAYDDELVFSQELHSQTGN
jgi:hypothetical protein